MTFATGFPRPHRVWILAAAAWFGLAAAFAPGLIAAVAAAAMPLRIGTQVVFWAVYLAGAVAIAVPRPLGLVALRLGAWILLLGGAATAAAPAPPLWRVLVPVYAAVVFALQMLPAVGDREMDGASYPGERRFGFRFPREAGGGIAVAVALPTFATADLLAALGTTGFVRVVCASGAVLFGAASYVAIRQLHMLARRWLVLAPRTLIAHDPYRLAQPLAIPYGRITDLAPVPGGGGPEDTKGLLDLRSGWAGAWLQLLCDSPAEPPDPRPLPTRLSRFAPEVPKVVVGVAFPVTDLDASLRAAAGKGLPAAGLEVAT